MKKILFIIALIFTMCLTASAQSDGYFRNDSEMSRDIESAAMPIIPNGTIGTIPDTNAPLGSGLVILTAMGAGYALARRKKNL